MAGLSHFGIGFAAKRIVPELSLALLLIAPMLLDILWIVLKILGITNPNLWTHSLVMAVVWSLLLLGLVFIKLRKLRPSLTLAALVLSHWLIDLLTHPMTAIFPTSSGVYLLPTSSVELGIGVDKTILGVIISEVVLLVPGVALYISTLRKQKKTSTSFMGK